MASVRRSLRRAGAVALLASGATAAGGAFTSASASPAGSGPAVAAAAALNLRSSDFPKGWKMYAAPSAASVHSVDAQMSQCYAGQYGHVLADVQSAPWSRGADTVSSDVEIFATPAEAAADLKALGSSLGVACAQESVRTTSATKTQPLDSIRAVSERIPVPATAAAGEIGVRTTLELLNPAQHPPTSVTQTYVFDEFVFLRDQAEVALSVGTSSGAKPVIPPASLERSFTMLLVARSKGLG